jgi:mono/diheme cytochrome c family protein
MPPFILKMSNNDTASVLTYIRSAWGNHSPPVTELEVTRARERE